MSPHHLTSYVAQARIADDHRRAQLARRAAAGVRVPRSERSGARGRLFVARLVRAAR